MREMRAIKLLVFDKLGSAGFNIFYIILTLLECFAIVGKAISFVLCASIYSPFKDIGTINVSLLPFMDNLILMVTTSG